MKMITCALLVLGSMSSYANNFSCRLELSKLKDPTTGGSIIVGSKKIKTVFSEMSDLTILSDSIDGYQADLLISKTSNQFEIHVYNLNTDGAMTQVKLERPAEGQSLVVRHSDGSDYTASVNCQGE